MTPRQWDQIADAFDRIADAGHRRPVSRLDERAARIFARMKARVVKRRKIPTSDAMRVMAKRARASAWADHCRVQARHSALRIDAGRAHPTTTGPVANDRLPSDRELDRFDRQRLAWERGRHLRAAINQGIE